ncbi:MAG: GNAT family N-acetyltransferase [bacterium]
MKFKPIIESDLEKIRKLQPEGWPDIIENFKYYIKASFCNPIKVLSKDEIVGIGTAVSYINTGWLAHIIVSEDHRSKGIGGSIVNYLCSYLKKKKHKTISLIASELGYPVYKKAGFIQETEYIFLERTELLEEFSSENISLIKDKDKDYILSLDIKVSGENRQELLSQFLNDGFVYHEGRKVLGYYLKELGEGLIISDDLEAGKELMKFRSLYSKTAVLPIQNKNGIEFLKSIGIEEKLSNKRMVYGKEIIWNPNKVFNRIGGNFG